MECVIVIAPREYDAELERRLSAIPLVAGEMDPAALESCGVRFATDLLRSRAQ